MANLAGIAKNIPILNRKAAQRAQDAQMYQFLGALGGAPAQPAGAVATAQQVAPKAAAAAAEIAAKSQAATQEGLLGAGRAALAQEDTLARQALGRDALSAQAGLSAAGRATELGEASKDIASRQKLTGAELAQKTELFSRGLDLDEKANFLSRTQREDLAKLGGDLEDQLFTSRLVFDRSETGRKFSNERQLEDWAVSRAISKVDRDRVLRNIKKQADFDLAAMDIIEKKVAQKLEQDMQNAIQRGDQETQRQLATMQADMKARQARAAAQSERTATLLKVGTGIAVAGAIIATGGAAAPAIAAGGAIAAS